MPDINVSIVHLSSSQKDDSERRAILSDIAEQNECDTLAAEKIFDKQYPEYQDKIMQRTNLFSFANDILQRLLV